MNLITHLIIFLVYIKTTYIKLYMAFKLQYFWSVLLMNDK